MATTITGNKTGVDLVSQLASGQTPLTAKSPSSPALKTVFDQDVASKDYAGLAWDYRRQLAADTKDGQTPGLEVGDAKSDIATLLQSQGASDDQITDALKAAFDDSDHPNQADDAVLNADT